MIIVVMVVVAVVAEEEVEEVVVVLVVVLRTSFIFVLCTTRTAIFLCIDCAMLNFRLLARA
jgi:hypothetical protein